MQTRRRPDRDRLDRSRPFRRAEALKAGLTISDLTGPRFQRVFHGVYAAAGVRLTPVEKARAARWISAKMSYASHDTAARIWGGIPPGAGETHLSVPDGAPRTKRRGIVAHRGFAAADVRTHRGIRVSSPTQCFCELAAYGARLVDLVFLGDSLVKAGVTTADDLVVTADGWQHRCSALPAALLDTCGPESIRRWSHDCGC